METTRSLTVPGLEGVSPPMVLDISLVHEAESRLIESKTVNPATYKDLEYLYNQGYRQARQNLSAIDFQIVRTERQIEREKARVILEVLPEKLEGKPASYNNADFRASILATDEAYRSVCERLDMLKAQAKFFEIRISVFEKACQYMRKGIDLIIRSNGSNVGVR
jgi:hypothetical protein